MANHVANLVFIWHCAQLPCIAHVTHYTLCITIICCSAFICQSCMQLSLVFFEP